MPLVVQVDYVMNILKQPEYKDVKFVIFSKWHEPIRQLVDRFKTMRIMHGEITGVLCTATASANCTQFPTHFVCFTYM